LWNENVQSGKINKIFVVIISRQPLLRAGIEHSLSQIGGVEILQAGDFQKEVLSRLDMVLPDVIIVDIDDSSDERFKIVREIKQHLPNIGVIIISNNDDDEQIFQALKSQAAAYLTRDVTTEELGKTVRQVANGEYPINETFVNRPKVASQVVEQFQGLALSGEVDFVLPLTSREREVLEYIAQGYPNKQIADKLEISEQTIKNHVTSVLRKLNANSRTEAVVQAIKRGLISVN
jgi:two-component system response regulator DegU